jgi:flagellar hook-associated protein 1 FlgK
MSATAWVGLNTALRGLLASQSALDVTAHNIANVNTDGYTRREAVLATSTPVAQPGVGQVGTGVDVVQYRRIRDDLLDVQLRAETMRQGYAGARQEGLSRVETTLGEPSDNGLGSLLDRYWSTWQDVANSPESMPARQALVQTANALTDGFQSLSSRLSALQADQGTAAADAVGQINSLGTQIGQLSVAIMDSKAVSLEPNDLIDQRALLLDHLAQLVNVSVTESANGGVTVTAGGATLVSANGSVASPPLVESDLTALSSGKLKGLVELRDTVIPSYLAQLDAVAGAVASQTNTMHAAGFDLSGTAGGAFFTGTTASTIAVAAGISASPATIAASGDGSIGSGTNALAISNLRSAAAVSGATIDDAYAQLVTGIGSDSRDAQSAVDTAQARADVLSQRRSSISGVSLDEEMTNIVRFQRGYQAAARVMTTMDEAIETLITRTGRVGL